MKSPEDSVKAVDPRSRSQRPASVARRLFGDLRQLLFDPAFRICSPELPAAPPAVETRAEPPEEKPQDAPQPSQAAAAERSKDLTNLVAVLATGLWRIRQRILKEGNGEPPEEWRRLYRYVESAWDALHSAGAEVHDHTGERYVTGMALRVLAFQPREGVAGETVEETIKPSIFFRDRLIQRGEVLVTTPLDEKQVAPEKMGEDSTQ